jgi:hypothetical protein
MIDKDPTTWELSTWLFALLMPCAGGLVNWYGKVKAGKARSFNIVELIGEVFTSGFVGLGVFMMLQSYDQPLGVCAALSGVSGHMATRLLFVLENYVEARVVAATNVHTVDTTTTFENVNGNNK